MNAKNRRLVNGYIWNAELTRLHRSHAAIRTLISEIIQAAETHPPSVRLLLSCAAQIALELNGAMAALRELEYIVRDQSRDQLRRHLMSVQTPLKGERKTWLLLHNN